MNKKCYIAGPISGRPEEEYRADFDHARAEVKAMGFEPICPTYLPPCKSWEDYMRQGIGAMFECRTIYALKGWQNSKGASIEVNLALQLGMDIFQQK